MYFRKHLQTFGQVSLSLDNLLKECGYSTKSHNQSIYSDFRSIIKDEVIDRGYATCDEDILSISPSKFFYLQLSETKTLFFAKGNFVNFSIAEYERIANSDSKINKSVLAGVYLFIKQYIMDYGDDNGKTPQISYPSKQQIKDGIGVSSLTTIEKAISALKDLRLIYVRGDMYVQSLDNSNVYIPTRNVFSLHEEHLMGDFVLTELEKVYGRTVYNKDDIKGNISFLSK